MDAKTDPEEVLESVSTPDVDVHARTHTLHIVAFNLHA